MTTGRGDGRDRTARPATPRPLRTFTTLDALTRAVGDREDLYVRWSLGPEHDLREESSQDELTGVALPGLSASPLGREAWWGDRSARLWVARRLYDYCHLPRVRDPRTRPWLLRGTEVARGPDNEPLVTGVEPLGWIARAVIAEARDVVEEQSGRWGPLDRAASS
ncbi:DUF6098 family protein [Streptomyces sp. NPDC015232]|uniref:DUF6098 family protein n=1 Tax=unclassified Streptomyces TaxID=2593676 RepID=UPI0036FA92EE